MKKNMTYSILVVLLLTIVVVGGTYAYFSTVISGNSGAITGNSEEFEVVYNGGYSFDGIMYMVANKNDGYVTSVDIKVTKNVPGITSDIVFTVESISNNLKINGFKWESYKVENGTETLLKSGNFSGESNGSTFTLADNVPLTTTPTVFKVYVWLDGNDPTVGNNVADGTAAFSGYISAKTNNFTGKLQ